MFPFGKFDDCSFIRLVLSCRQTDRQTESQNKNYLFLNNFSVNSLKCIFELLSYHFVASAIVEYAGLIKFLRIRVRYTQTNP